MLLALSGLDPSGAAGLNQDIVTAHCLGAQVYGAATCLTSQTVTNAVAGSTSLLGQIKPTLSQLLHDDELRQSPISSIKLGLLGDNPTAIEIAQFAISLNQKTEKTPVPIVWDPVIWATSGAILWDAKPTKQTITKLLSACSVITPNNREWGFLAAAIDAASSDLLQVANHYNIAIVVTGADDAAAERRPVITRLVQPQENSAQPVHEFEHDYIDIRCRGTGCRFATSLAVHIARGLALPAAVVRTNQEIGEDLSVADDSGLLPMRIRCD